MSVKPLLICCMACTAILSASNSLAKTYELEGYAEGTQIDVADQSFEGIYLDGSSLIGEISSDFAYSGTQSLKLQDLSTANKPYIRLPFAEGAADFGLVKARIYIPSGNAKSTYIHIGTGKNNSDRYFEIKITGSGVVQYENGNYDPDIASITTDEWHLFEVFWSDGKFTVGLDRKIVADEIPVLNADQVPNGVVFYTGDKSNAGNVAYFDDIRSDLF